MQYHGFAVGAFGGQLHTLSTEGKVAFRGDRKRGRILAQQAKIFRPEDASQIGQIGRETRVGLAGFVRGRNEESANGDGLGGTRKGSQSRVTGEQKDEADGLHGLAPSFCANNRRA